VRPGQRGSAGDVHRCFGGTAEDEERHAGVESTLTSCAKLVVLRPQPLTSIVTAYMKRIFLSAALMLAGCADEPNKPSQQDVVATAPARPRAAFPEASTPESLHTTVSGRNIADITRDVQGWHDMQYADCKFVKVLGAEVVSQDEKSITEHWTIEACKQQSFTYNVLIVRNPHALSDAVSNLDGSSAKPK
jgi:hypothetical protein